MDRKENKLIIGIFILMAITFLGTLTYAKIKPKTIEQDYKRPKKEEKKDIVVEKEVKYTNYTETSIDFNSKGVLSLNITDGVFTMKFEETDLKLTGIDENIKSFTYDENAYVVARNNSGVIILLLSENNNVYVGFYEENDKVLFFRKITTNLNIKDITTTDIISTSKSSIKTAVVLDQGEVRPIIESGKIYIISNKDTSRYEKVFDNIVIYNDGTIASTSNLNSKLKYNNQDMIVNKILSIKSDDDYKCYYIITNKKLFKLCGKNRYKANPNVFDDIELVNKKTIIGTTNLSEGYHDSETEYEVVYDDNTKETFTILSAYIR